MNTQRDSSTLFSTGWALQAVFLITVLAASVPFRFSSPEWGTSFSRLIVDAASLSLVGLCLVRYALYLDARRLPRSSQEKSPGDDSTSQSAGSVARTGSKAIPNYRQRQALQRIRTILSWLARIGMIGMVMVALWQVPLFMRSLSGIDRQLLTAANQETQRFAVLEQALKTSPPQQIQQSWSLLNTNQVSPSKRRAVSTTPSLNIEDQRRDLLKRANGESRRVRADLNRQAFASRFALGRDHLRVLLVALAYGWAYWVFVRPS